MVRSDMEVVRGFQMYESRGKRFDKPLRFTLRTVLQFRFANPAKLKPSAIQ